LHRVVVGREQVGHLLIELAEVILDRAQHPSSIALRGIESTACSPQQRATTN
jgi:hypothetical protein